MSNIVGIPDKTDYGDLSKLQPGQVLDLILQQHNAKRRGLHYDLRLGNKELGMYSWALNDPPETKDKQHAIHTHLHDHSYNQFEGEIPKGYGAGTVSKYIEGKALITNKTDKSISFSRADKKYPERYSLINPYKDSKVWQLRQQATPDNPGVSKGHYKSIPKDQIRDLIDKLEPGTEMQAKIDGALQLLKLNNGKAEMLSHRISKTTGKPVVQTERFFGKIPHFNIPKEYRNSVLMAEVYGNKQNKAIPVQDLAGLLNSSVSKSLDTQNREGIGLKGVLFDINRLRGKSTESMPYQQRKALVEKILQILPKGKFEMPEATSNPKEGHKLLDQIEAGKHPKTSEGIVIHKPHGAPMKYKVMPESDVWIRGMFDAEKGSKYEGKGVGGFEYSHKPDGPVVGRVGTGLSDLMRKMMYEDPEGFKQRLARIRSHGQYDKTTAHRVPSFISLHEDYPSHS